MHQKHIPNQSTRLMKLTRAWLNITSSTLSYSSAMYTQRVMFRGTYVGVAQVFVQPQGPVNLIILHITVTSEKVRWRLKSSASRLFIQLFVQAQIKENIKAPRHWPLWEEFIGDRWIPRMKGQWRGKSFHLMKSSWSSPRSGCTRSITISMDIELLILSDA